MDPPPRRVATNPDMHEFQVRPHFATASGPVTRARPLSDAPENLQTPMQRSCQRGHEEVAEPLLTVNRYREEYAPRAVPAARGTAIHPKLMPRPTPKKQHMINTWN